MTYQLFRLAKQQNLNSSVQTLPGALAYFYLTGTTTPTDTYQDSDRSTPHTNPVVADAGGFLAPIYLDPTIEYKVVLRTSAGVLLYEADPVNDQILSQAVVGALLYPTTTAETAASVTPVNFQYPPGAVDRYATNTAPGTTNMATAIQAALNTLVQAGGGKLIFQDGETYFVGAITSSAALLSVTGLTRVHIEGNGAEIVSATSGVNLGTILQLTNPSKITGSINFRDTGTDLSQEWQGPRALSITTSGASGEASDIDLTLGVEDCVTGLDCFGSDARRVRDIHVVMYVKDCYYGLNCREQGDGISGVIYCENVRRPYLCYGVRGHDLLLDITHDGSALGSNGAVYVKRVERDTKSVRLRSVFHGSTAQYGGLVVLETQPTSGTATIDDVDIDLRLADAAYNSTSVPVRIRALDAGGSLQASTNDILDRIAIRGNFGAWAVANTNNPILIESTPNTVRRLAIDGVLWGAFKQDRQHFPGYRVRVAPSVEVYTKQGDLTSGNIAVDLTDYNGRNFCLRLKVFAEAEYDVGSTNQTYNEILVQGNNASGGAVAIGTTTLLENIDNGTGSTLTIAASGETITVSFDTYTSADAYARVAVEHLSKFL